jgi:Gas vesicle synthesis protein GvpO
VTEPTEAQRKRSQARERRRGQAAPAEKQPGDGVTEGGEEPLEAVKHAAKVAAAGAAVGAAAAAARALTSRDEDEEHESEPVDEAKGAPAAGQESSEATARPSGDGPAEQAEEAPTAEKAPQKAEPRPGRDGSSQEARAEVADDGGEEPVQGASPDEATETVQRARQQLSALLERPVESVSAFERLHDGWLVTLEVVEVSRIPESTDVLASYEVELDDDRNLRRYARVRRYIRSQADRGDQR